MNNGKCSKFISAVLYTTVFLVILAVIILRFCGVIKEFDIEYIYLLLLLSVLAVIPQFKKISFRDLSLEKETSSVKNADQELVNKTEKEERNELSKQAKGKSKKTVSEIKAAMLEAYCKNRDSTLNKDDFDKNRQIVHVGDPINTDNPIYSWYTNKNGRECLYEAKFTEINKAYYNKLYVMLAKIISYNKINGKKLKLVLLLKRMDKDGVGVSSGIDNLEDTFSPAIDSGLLRVEVLS